MADNAPNPTELQATVDRLNTLAGGVRKALGLGDDADDAAVLSALGTVTTQRDEAVASAAKISTERNAEKMDAEIRSAVTKAGIFAQSTDDATTILRSVLEVTDKGEVRTKAAPNVVPGQTVEQFIAGQLKTMRPHYWPTSIGAGAKGAGFAAHAGPDVSCFKGGTLTDQYALVARVGERAAIEACRRSGIVPPSWLIGGAR